jgi:hypothetical protein
MKMMEANADVKEIFVLTKDEGGSVTICGQGFYSPCGDGASLKRTLKRLKRGNSIWVIHND